MRMRVISGTLGGRQFQTPGGHRTHPMSEKMRGAMFNILGDVSGLAVFDPFAGSGALTFEAISRGAARSLMTDSDLQAQATIEANQKELGLKQQTKLVKSNAAGWSKNNPKEQFDLMLCDPPYDHLQEDLLEKLERHLHSSGTLVLSWPSDIELPRFKELEIVAQKQYGEAQLVFYQKTG